MIPFYAVKSSENLAKSRLAACFCLASSHYEDINIMQTYNTTGANPAQNFQNQRSGITFVILFSLALFLAYAVSHHMITDVFSYLMAQLFDGFSIKNSSLTADIFLLVAFLLMLFGLFCVFKFFLPIAITVLIIGVIAWIFLAPESDQPHEVKIKSGEKFERVYGG
jgi:hypothetical protein